MWDKILFLPPVAFGLLFLAILILFGLCTKYTFKNKKKSSGAKKAYACGEDFADHLIQPDYSQFFPFAFFFTILHVVALMIATVPAENLESFVMAVVYVVGAIIGLVILLRK